MAGFPLFVATEWLEERLDDPKLRILDATTYLKPTEGYYKVWSGREAYDEEHIPGAVYADLYKELSHPDAPFAFTIPPREQFVEKISELGVGDGTYAVVYDRGAEVGTSTVANDWASRLAWQLKYEGFDDVAVLVGGFSKWKEEVRPVSTEPGSYPKANFTGERRPEMLATKEDVKKAMEDDDVVLINSLSEADFRGETNTYKRSGRIPGSEHVFFGSHSNPETQELLEDNRIRENFEKAGALDPDKKVITYCGSGIAATWNALLLNKLGQTNVAMYDGSMTEWTEDPSLPLEKGEK
ncbi:sulfurtransferase [Virgibacillus sediminis]|uniref:Sulfurtransferase n=1 Tax=Virgibacillus sediminis TaxID=202260 RepID=A0ABV7A9I6_9BACI